MSYIEQKISQRGKVNKGNSVTYKKKKEEQPTYSSYIEQKMANEGSSNYMETETYKQNKAKREETERNAKLMEVAEQISSQTAGNTSETLRKSADTYRSDFNKKYHINGAKVNADGTVNAAQLNELTKRQNASIGTPKSTLTVKSKLGDSAVNKKTNEAYNKWDMEAYNAQKRADWNRAQNAEKMAENVDKAFETAKNKPGFGAADSVYNNLLGSALTPISIVQQKVTNPRGDIDYNTPAFRATREGTAERQGIKAGAKIGLNNRGVNMLDEYGNQTLAAKAVDFGIDTGLSMADTVVRGMATPTIGGIQAGLAAGSQAFLDAKDAGADDAHALLQGTAQGIAEEFFEKVSLQGLKSFKSLPADSVRQIAKNIAKQSFTEGSEEFFTDWANTVTDALIMQDESDLMQRYNNYLDNGDTKAQALGNALKDILIQSGLSFLGGAISGGILGGGAQAINYNANRTVGQDMRANDENYTEDDLRELSNAIDVEPTHYTNKNTLEQAESTRDYLENLANEVANGNPLSDTQLGAVTNEVMGTVSAASNDATQQAIQNETLINLANEITLNQGMEPESNNVEVSSSEGTTVDVDTTTTTPNEAIHNAEEVVFNEGFEVPEDWVSQPNEVTTVENAENQIENNNSTVEESSTPYIPASTISQLREGLSDTRGVFDGKYVYRVFQHDGDEVGIIYPSDGHKVTEDGVLGVSDGYLYISEGNGSFGEARANIINYAKTHGLITDDETPSETVSNMLSMEETLLGEDNAENTQPTETADAFSSQRAEIERRANARFGSDISAKAREAYIGLYNGQDVVEYDDAMAKAYTAGRNGKSLPESYGNDEDFSNFYKKHYTIVDAMWNLGYAEREASNKSKNDGGNANVNEVEEVHNGRGVQKPKSVRKGTDSRHGGARAEENGSIQEGRNPVDVSEGDGGVDDGAVRGSTGPRVSRVRGDGVSEGNKVQHNEQRHGVKESEGVANAASSEETSGKSEVEEINEKAKESAKTADNIASQPEPKGTNYVITNETTIPTTESARCTANIEAISVLKNIIAESRIATTDEQKILANFTGWGGISDAKWKSIKPQLEGTLTESELKTAAESLNTAYYTEPSLIRSMYNGMKTLGFNGGRLLEPSAGVGRFIGAMPTELIPKTKWTAVELDEITGSIAKYLYPNADVRVQGFEKAKVMNDYMDVVIGNVPFGDFGVYDKRYPRHITNLIHNYFIMRSLDTLREGGIACLITSSGTMDSEKSAARLEFMSKADLIGAIRLPNTAFKGTGTDVVSDILVFKKRKAGAPYSGETFTESKRNYLTTVGYRENEYFANHPEMVLGEKIEVSSRYGRAVSYKPLDTKLTLEEQIEKAFGNIKERMEYPIVDNREETRKAIEKAKNSKEGSAYKRDGKLYINENGAETALELAAKQENIYSTFVDIRDTARALVNEMQLGTSDKKIADLRKLLNEQYDAFINTSETKKDSKTKKQVTTYPFAKGFHTPSVRNVIKNDTDYAFVLALEKIEKRKVNGEEEEYAVKADIFTRNTINPVIEITSVDNISDGIEASINELGYIDTDRIAELMSKDKSDIESELANGDKAYKDINGNWVSATTYLSGNVRAKLAEAEALAATDKAYKKNVEALKKVVPERIKGTDIVVNVGVTWIPTEYYAQFAAELFGISPKDVFVDYDPAIGYTVDTNDYLAKNSPKNRKTWGTEDMPFFYETQTRPGMFYSLLNSKDLTVKRSNGIHEKPTIDTVATEALRDLKDKINKEFNTWLWKNGERSNILEDIYNDSFNCMVRPTYSADVTIPGQTGDITLREHQGRAINRIVQSPYCTLLQHGAGAGKTFAMIGAVMKLRQLGQAKKPAIVVPKNKIGDWRNDFFEMFPSAKVLVADDTTFSTKNRKTFANKIATTDIDCVILSKEQFQYMPMTDDAQKEFYESQIRACEEALEKAKNKEGSKLTERRLQKRLAQLKASLQKKMDSKKDNDNIRFEETGIDFILADEAQSYKNLAYFTSRTNVADMGAAEGNNITTDMLMKSNYIRAKQNGKGIVFGTATPVMNSPVEAYTMLRYLANEELEKRKIRTLDNFIDMFGRVETRTQMDAVGREWKIKNAFNGFVNMLEWQQLWGMVTDVVKTEDVPGIKLPKVKGGDRNVIVCEAGDKAREVIEGLADRLKSHDTRGANHVFRLQTDGKKASFSQRFFDPSLPYGDNEKVPKAVDEIFKIWKESKTFTDVNGETQENGVQLVFCDRGVPKDSKKVKTEDTESFNPDDEISDDRLNVYQDMKDMLIAKGVPANEIAFIHDPGNDGKKLEELYNNVRKGRVRILIGSAQKMGEGLNVQERVVALHEMNPLARPGDIEQVEARAIRQGNLSPEVAINVYVTEDTFDTKQWDTLRNKSKFISEITSGTFKGRNADFSSDEFGASAADIMAVASGNPLLKEQVEANERLRKLQDLKKAHDRKVYNAKTDLDKAEKRLAWLNETLPKYEADAKKVRDLNGDNFAGRASGKTYTDKGKFGEAVNEASKKAIASENSIVKFGSISGFDLYASGKSVSVELRGETTYKAQINYNTGAGTTTRIINVLSDIKSMPDKARAEIKNIEASIPLLEEEADSKFDKAKELKEATNKAAAIEQALLGKDKAPETKINPETGEILDDETDEMRTDRSEKKPTIDRTEDWQTTKTSENTVEKPKSLTEIIADIQHEFGINITTGHIKADASTQGLFNRRDKGIRTRITNYLPTISHELGHWFDTQYEMTKYEGTLSEDVKKELKEALGEKAEAYPKKKHLREGMAEFFRKWLQNNETAAIDYPNLTEYVLSKLDPKDYAKLSAIADQINAYYAMGAENAEDSIIPHEKRIIDKRTFAEKLADRREQEIQRWIDNRHGIRLMGESVGSGKSYIYATNAAYADARATEIILNDITDIDGRYVAPGLKKALHGINTDIKSKEYINFGEYLVMRHGLEFLKEGKRVFADDRMNSTNFMENRIAELDEQYPKFAAAAERLYTFIDAFMQTYAIDAGLLSFNQYKSIKTMYPEYVPFFRAGYKNKGNSLAHAKGSGRAIIHPVDNIINMVTKMVSNATYNNVMLKIREESLQLGVDAKFIEKIPEVKVPKEFDMRGIKADLRDRTMEALSTYGASADLNDTLQQTIDEISDTLTQFELARANDVLRKNIVVILVNGKKEYWKVNDPLLFESITNMNAHSSNAVLDAYAHATRFMTSNITGRNVIWSLFSNSFRDLQTAYIYMRNGNPTPLVKGIAETWINSFKNGIGKEVSPLYREYLAMGGSNAGVWQGQETFVQDIRKMLNNNYRKLGKNPLAWISFISETIEMGPRFAMYSYYRTHGYKPQKAFYEAMDVTVNFRRHGTVSKDVNKAVQFFNASVQGVDKGVRFFTAEDMRGTDKRKKIAMRRTVMFAVVSAALAALQYALNNHDDESEKYYQTLSNYTKNAYHLIPLGNGKYFALPKARELGALQSLLERALERTVGGNEHAFDDFYSYWAENCLPSIVSDVAQIPFRTADEGLQSAIDEATAGVVGSVGLLGVLANTMANRDFLGRPIVSNTYKESLPKDQYDAKTSEMAYLIGQALNLSPQKIDYFGENFLGVLWEVPEAIFPVDDGKGVKGEGDITFGVKNKYLKDASYSNDLVNWLYDSKDKSEAATAHDENDIDAAIEYKMDSLYTSFYSKFNRLNKTNATSAQREAKFNVLDTISGYRTAKESNIYPEGCRIAMQVAKQCNDTSILPSVMNTYVKDANKKQYDLSDVRYMEYQSLYNKYYYENIEELYDKNAGKDEKLATLKTCKTAAYNKATNQMLAKFSGANIDKSKESASASIAKSNYNDALKEMKAKAGDENLSSADKLDLSMKYYKDSGMSAEDFYYSTLDKNQKAKYDSWKSKGGNFNNYDELLSYSEYTADKKSDGKTVSGSKKNKVANAILDDYEDGDINKKLMQVAWEMAGYKDDLEDYTSSNKFTRK